MIKLPTKEEISTAAYMARVSMRSVCVKAGVSPTVWYRWRDGDFAPTFRTLEKIVNVLNGMSNDDRI